MDIFADIQLRYEIIKLAMLYIYNIYDKKQQTQNEAKNPQKSVVFQLSQPTRF